MRRLLELGYQDDVELMLQVSRALFREGLFDDAREYVDVVLQQTPDSSEAVALLGYVQHRAGQEETDPFQPIAGRATPFRPRSDIVLP